MEWSLAQYEGPCACGETHAVLTRFLRVGTGVTRELPDFLAASGLMGGVVVCDENTRPYAAVLKELLAQWLAEPRLFVFPAARLHADEAAVARLEAALPTHTGFLVAAGAGTIHDITRYAAHSRGIPLISYPTAASVDGFASSVSAMTWHGFKKTMPGTAPLCIVADTGVFARAPYRMTASGVSDVLGKYTALLDWQVSQLVTGEPLCPRILHMSLMAADEVRASMPLLRAGGAEAMEKLMRALLLSGLAMQMWGNSRPASGAEHHLAHLWEMAVISPSVDALHGESVGVAALLILSHYKQLLSEEFQEDPPPSPPPEARLREVFGARYAAVAAENDPDPLEALPPGRLMACLPTVRALVAKLPEPEPLAADMAAAGCPVTLAQLGLPSTVLPDSLTFAPYIRRRLTLLRLMGRLRPGS